MKKIVLTMTAMLAVLTASAANVNSQEPADTKAYEWHVNMNKLNDVLGLTSEQWEDMVSINSVMDADLKKAFKADGDIRNTEVQRALTRNVKMTKQVLNDKQMRVYLRLLNFTVNNRGLFK